MARPRSPWYHRYRHGRAASPGVGLGQQPQDYTGGEYANSTELAYEYLWGSLRTNAPGYADQNYFELSRQFLGIPYLAISNKSQQAGQAEILLYEQDGDDPDSRVPLSVYEDAYELIHNPNPDDEPGEIIEQASLQYELCGTALLWVPHDVEDPHEPPREMYVLSTASAIPQPISPRYPNGAYLVQPWYPAGPYAMIPVSQGVGATIPAEQVIRIKKPHPFFRWIGYSTLFAVSQQMDAARMIDVSRTNAFQKGIDPSFVLTFDPSIRQPDEATLRRLEAQLGGIYAGAQNTGKGFFAPVGSDIKTLSNTPKDMAYQEGYSQLMDFGLAAFNMNKAVTGQTDGLTYATLYASMRWFYLMSLNPFLKRVAAKMTRQLLRPFFGRNMGMDLKGSSVNDEQLLESKVNTWIKARCASIGEIRKQYDLPPSKWDEERAGDQPKEQGGPGGGLEALLGGKGGKGGERPGESVKEHTDPDQAAAQRGRPVNREGQGTGVQRPGLKTPHERTETLGKGMEKALRNGFIHANGKGIG